MLRPLHDYLLLEPIEQAGELIATGEDNNFQRGRILAVGEGAHTTSGSFIEMDKDLAKAIGKVVHFGRFAEKNSTVLYEGRKFFLVRAGDLIAIEED